ncbi:MAG TPA: hypothetical protein DCL54_11120 [Alphaproteobacteria bacterium]|nr:hypothetical protein [Alphaproteobacteria bacterium]HAJ47117.1 hypothetical protein [Alphaproteobacteria bacterium]
MPVPYRLITIFGCAALLAACGDNAGQSSQASKAQSRAEPTAALAPAFTEAVVKREEIAQPVVGTGSIYAVKTTDLGPSVDGIIQEIYVKVGDQVRKGQALFKTRDVDARFAVQEVERQLALAKAQADNARSEMRRQSQLKSGGWVSTSRMDTISTNARVTDAQVGVWEARLAAARQVLNDTTVRAPYDGVITRRDADEGKFMATRIPGGGAGGGGGGVVQIMYIATVAAIVQVPEAYLPAVTVGVPVTLRIDSLDREFKSTVTVVNHRLDLATRSVEVRIALPNQDLAIRPGLFVRAEFAAKPRPVLVVDRNAIFGPDGAHYAFRLENGIVRKVSLSARAVTQDRMELLTNVPEGTRLLMGAGIEALKDGDLLPGLGPKESARIKTEG